MWAECEKQKWYIKCDSEKRLIFLLVQIMGLGAQLKCVTQWYESVMTVNVGLGTKLVFPIAKDYGDIFVSAILTEELETPVREMTDPQWCSSPSHTPPSERWHSAYKIALKIWSFKGLQ